MKKQVCSIRLPEEILREIEKIAKKEDRTRGAVIRRIVQHFFSKEESHESDHRENHSGGCGIAGHGGLQPDHQSGPRTVIKQSSKQED